MHDYITVSPAQYFVHLNSCVIRNLATSMTFNAPPKRPAQLVGKTVEQWNVSFQLSHIMFEIQKNRFRSYKCLKYFNKTGIYCVSTNSYHCGQQWTCDFTYTGHPTSLLSENRRNHFHLRKGFWIDEISPVVDAESPSITPVHGIRRREDAANRRFVKGGIALGFWCYHWMRHKGNKRLISFMLTLYKSFIFSL